MPDERDARRLGAELRALLDAEVADVSLNEWNEKMLQLFRRLTPEVVNVVSNGIWDWCSDADVRRKEPTIRAQSTEEIHAVIAQLERGVWPD